MPYDIHSYANQLCLYILDGRRYREIPAITAFEFGGEKIQHHRLYYDRLSMNKKMAKGWFEKMIMGSIVNRWEKGLH